MNINNPLHEKYVICSDMQLKKDVLSIAKSLGYRGLRDDSARRAKVLFFGSRHADRVSVTDFVGENYLKNHRCTEIKVEDILDDEYTQKELKRMRVMEELNE